MILREIPNFPNYFLNEKGRLYSTQFKELRKRRVYIQKNGYVKANLSKNGKCRYFYLHRLMLETFIGPCPEGMESDHIDMNPGNNHINNLRWLCRKENSERRRFKLGSKHPNSNLKEEEVWLIKKLLAESNLSQYKIAKIFKKGRSCIKHIKLGNTWSHVI